MELKEEEILKNKERFVKIVTDLILPKYEGAKDLLDWTLKTDFFDSPASTKYHLNCKGGLCFHSLNVYDRLIKLSKDEYGDDYATKMGTTDAGIALSALFHDICKANTYVTELKNVKTYYKPGEQVPYGTKSDSNGYFKWETVPAYSYDPAFVLGHGSKSLYIVQSFVRGVTLNEASAIYYHMGAEPIMGFGINTPDYATAYANFNLALFLHIADSLATFVDEKEE